MDQYWRVDWTETRQVISNVTYTYDENGNVTVEYEYEDQTYHLIDYTAFNLKDKTMNMVRHPNNVNKWRCYFDVVEIPVVSGDVTSDDINEIIKGTVMNIEVTSDNTITVVHEGIVRTPTSYRNRMGSNGANLITYDQIDFNYIKQ